MARFEAGSMGFFISDHPIMVAINYNSIHSKTFFLAIFFLSNVKCGHKNNGKHSSHEIMGACIDDWC